MKEFDHTGFSGSSSLDVANGFDVVYDAACNDIEVHFNMNNSFTQKRMKNITNL